MENTYQNLEEEKRALLAERVLWEGTWLPISKAAQLRNVSVGTIQKRVLQGQVLAVKLEGAPVLVRVEDIEEGTGLVGRPPSLPK